MQQANQGVPLEAESTTSNKAALQQPPRASAYRGGIRNAAQSSLRSMFSLQSFILTLSLLYKV